MMLEYQTAPAYMETLPVEAPSVYRWLAREPKGTLTIEFPVPTPDVLPGQDPIYMYFSTMHWQPLVNGYSGHHPAGYLQLLELLRAFPDEASMRALDARGVDAMILHRELYERLSDYEATFAWLDARPEVQLMGIWKDHRGEARAYRWLRR
jgi:hypothetical protein